MVTQLVQMKGLTATARWWKVGERNDSEGGEGRWAGFNWPRIRENSLLEQNITLTMQIKLSQKENQEGYGRTHHERKDIDNQE